MNETRILSLFILLQLSTMATAQILGLNASFHQAYGEFNRNIDHDPMGIAMSYVHAIDEQRRFSVGAELGVAMYASKTYQLVVPEQEALGIYEEDCFWTIHVLGQTMLYRTSSFQLFGEARLGITTFFSESHVIDDADGQYDDYDEFRTHGTAFNLGLGGGLRYNVSGLFKGDPRIYDRLWLSASAAVCTGTRTDYRNAGEDVTSLEDPSYRSLTNYVGMRFGLGYNFAE